MLWMYQRGHDDIRITTTYDSVTREYVIKSTRPNGTTVERFKDAAAYKVRLAALEVAFQREGWHRVGHPLILDYGWKAN